MAGKWDLIEELQARVEGLTKAQAKAIVEAIFDTIRRLLARGERVQIPGFGSFSVSKRAARKRAARKGRQPATGATITFRASRSVRFRDRSSLKGDGGRPRKTKKTAKKLARRRYTVVEVFYATDRKPTGFKQPRRRYGSERGNGSLDYGVCEVSIPEDHKIGHLEGPSWRRFEFRADPKKHVVLLDVGVLPGDRFFDRLSGTLQKASRREILLFLHGFNVSFENAARRTAQIAYDLKFEGSPAFYSWPSKGQLSLTGYTHDETNVEWTIPHLREFLEGLAARSGAEAIHLIAHSMGNRALTRALEQLAAVMADPEAPSFTEVVLTAPDIDADVFRQVAAAFRRAARRVTLYASEKDRALQASHKFHGYPRAGDAGENVVVVPGVDTIDASAVDTNLVGHFYYGDNRSVLSDIFHLLQDGKPPEDRFGLHPRQSPAGRYWIFAP